MVEVRRLGGCTASGCGSRRSATTSCGSKISRGGVFDETPTFAVVAEPSPVEFTVGEGELRTVAARRQLGATRAGWTCTAPTARR